MSQTLTPYDSARSIGVREACKMLRGRQGHATIPTIRRYCTVGAKCGDQVVLLPNVRIGGEIRLMPEWVEWFEQERARIGMRTTPRLARSPRSRMAAHRKAEERLKLLGM